ncbi:hypothetical protein TRFO_17303 [Tritrichomonas foetus]|uniref:Uncharacterized protein n=1 Tax=Tritrichomonas foetus TaxID=1144522 RepID=A0A1J4KSX0_9EUKA|nr:hypothetical protein TRFO_17303 [Tritrichomonas foetus]|eukprot:OHT12758.1 hypothetical protein TRFO_17303 [Tritrichomonas foetus]
MKNFGRRRSLKKNKSDASSTSSRKPSAEIVPSLVILSPDEIETPFMRRRFNPNLRLSLPSPANFLDLTDEGKKKRLDSLANKQNDVETEYDTDTDTDESILTDQQKMEIARKKQFSGNSEETSSKKDEFIGVGSVFNGPGPLGDNGDFMTRGILINDDDFFEKNENNDENKNNDKNKNLKNEKNDDILSDDSNDLNNEIVLLDEGSNSDNDDAGFSKLNSDQNGNKSHSNRNDIKRKRKVKNVNGEYEYEYYDNNQTDENSELYANNTDVNKNIQSDVLNKDENNRKRKKRKILNDEGQEMYEYYPSDEFDVDNYNENTGIVLDDSRKKRRIKNENGEYEYEYSNEDDETSPQQLLDDEYDDKNESNNDSNIINNDNLRNRSRRKIKNENGEYEYEYYYDANDDNENSKDIRLNGRYNEFDNKKHRIKNEFGEYEYEYYNDENETPNEINEDENNENENNENEVSNVKNESNDNVLKRKRKVKNDKGEYEYQYYDYDEGLKKRKKIKNGNVECGYEYDEDNENLFRPNENKSKKKRRIKNSIGEYEYQYYDNDKDNSNDIKGNKTKPSKKKIKVKNGNGDYEYHYYDNEDDNHQNDNDNEEELLKKKTRVKNKNGEYEYKDDDDDDDDLSKDKNNHVNSIRKKRRVKNENGEYEFEYYYSDDDRNLTNSQNKKDENEEYKYEYEYDEENDNLRRKINKLQGKHRGAIYNSDDFQSDDEFNDNQIHNNQNSNDLQNNKDFNDDNNKKLMITINKGAGHGKLLKQESNTTNKIDDKNNNKPKKTRNSLTTLNKIKNNKHQHSDMFPARRPIKSHIDKDFDEYSVTSIATEFDNTDDLPKDDNESYASHVTFTGDLDNYGDCFDNDNFSVGTNAYSVFRDGPDFNKKIHKQLDFGASGGDLFETQFDQFSSQNRRMLGRIGRLQAVQKRNWITKVWRLYDQTCTDENIWRTLDAVIASMRSENKLNRRNTKDRRNKSFMIKLNEDNNIKNKNNINRKGTNHISFEQNNDQAMYQNYIEHEMDTDLNGLIKSARMALHKFIITDGLAPNLNLRAVILGPRYSGKTTFLRSLFLESLIYLTNHGVFKSIFVVSFNTRTTMNNQTSNWTSNKEKIYKYVSSRVVDAILAQRNDLELFANSLTKAFDTLLTVPRVKKLPKPISSQDYLRMPMRSVDHLLTHLQELYHSPNVEEFIKCIFEMPRCIGEIFGFDTTLLVIDHIDKMNNITHEGVSLSEIVIQAIEKCQFIISVEESGNFNQMIKKVNNKNYKRRVSQVYQVNQKEIVSSNKSLKCVSTKTPIELPTKGTKMNSSTLSRKSSKGKSLGSPNKLESLINSLNDDYFVSTSFTRISVTGKCYSKFSDCALEVTFEDSDSHKNIVITNDTCGGCPAFIERFDSIVKGLMTLKQITNPRKHEEKAVMLTADTEILLDLLFCFGNDPDAGPPPIKTVSLQDLE